MYYSSFFGSNVDWAHNRSVSFKLELFLTLGSKELKARGCGDRPKPIGPILVMLLG